MLGIGKKAYRQFCGQCHALKEARAVGFGSAKQKGVGEDGGPSFNQLKVSYQMCLASVTMLFGGHEKVIRKMTWQQIKDVSKFVQYATRTIRSSPSSPTADAAARPRRRHLATIATLRGRL